MLYPRQEASSYGIKLSQKDKNELELHLRAAQLEMVSLLLEKGADPNAANKGKLTPLHNAAHHGRSQVVRKLITYHANVNILDAQGIVAGQSRPKLTRQ